MNCVRNDVRNGVKNGSVVSYYYSYQTPFQNIFSSNFIIGTKMEKNVTKKGKQNKLLEILTYMYVSKKL